MAQILVADDEPGMRNLLATMLGEQGHHVHSVASGEAALAAASEVQPALVLLDMRMDGIDGLETLRQLHRKMPDVQVVMMSAFGHVADAVKALRLGATDFLTKPFINRDLLDTVDQLLRISSGPPPTSGTDRDPHIVGESPAFHKAMNLAMKFAVPDINILLLGETGTGKELFARAIHAASKRKEGPFVAVDCSMLAANLIESELFGHEKGSFTGATNLQIGRFERAHGGTLFLDEIGNLPVEFQAKLLRILQERRFERVGGRQTIRLDVRVVAATNVDLLDGCRKGTFRQDLYYRLNEMKIDLPPLRARQGDITRIAEHFVAQFSERFGKHLRGLSPDAIACLEAHRWPGNVRELENTLKSAVVLAEDVVRAEDLPSDIPRVETPDLQDAHPSGSTPAAASGDGRLRFHIDLGITGTHINLKALGTLAAEQAERSLLQTLLRRRQMSGAQLARTLGVDPKTLRVKIRKYGLERLQ